MKFREDGTFHILQFADIQELPEASEDTMALIRRALDTARPDLVVLTGDQLKGYSRAFRKKPGHTGHTGADCVQGHPLCRNLWEP